MAEKDTRLPQISVTKLGGINLRKGRNQLDAGECDRNFGLYPAQTGLLSRMPGKTTWRVFEDGDTPREVLQVQQTFDGSGNVIVQNGDAIGLYTLNELRNRLESYSLTPTPAPPGIGSYALIAHIESNGTRGGAIGALDNTFYPAKTNTLLTDEDGIVVALTSTSFTLGLGIYQITATVSFGTVTNNAHCRAGLYSVTSGTFKLHYGTAYEILGTSGASFDTASMNGTIYIKGRFEVTETSEVLSIAMAGELPGGGSFSPNAWAQGDDASAITSKSEVYKLIAITKE